MEEVEERGDLEAVARSVLAAGIKAVDPQRLTTEYLRSNPEIWKGRARVHVVAIGKASVTMAAGTSAVLGAGVARGMVLAPESMASNELPGFEIFGAGHPVPTSAGLSAARSIRGLVGPLSAEDTMLLLISGGGSSLLTLPAEGLSLEELQATTTTLMQAGASIGELNSVRKHLDQLKGGQLARLAAPAEVVALVLSDVVGDPLDVIASGPVSPDSSSFRDALDVVERLGVARIMPEAVVAHLNRGAEGLVPENPAAADSCFEQVRVAIVGNNEMAASAVAAAASLEGFAAQVVTTTATGEARILGRRLGEMARAVQDDSRPSSAPACLVVAGETTVTVSGSGIGGRNQEVALAAALEIEDMSNVLIASMGTDGVDGPTQAAGAVATGDTVARGAELGLSAEDALEANDSNSFFARLEDLIVTGPTGTNVMDLAVVLIGA